MNQHLSVLKENGFKITPLRKAILETFQKKQVTLTAEDLYRLIKRQIPKAGLQSVYRNLAEFSEAGIAEEVFLDKRKSAYTICKDFEDHHHHAVCRRCGHSEEIKTCGLKSVSKTLNRSLKNLKKTIGFRIEKHFLQLEGLCRDCQK